MSQKRLANPKNHQEKAEVIKTISEKIDSASSFVIFNYQGITAAEFTSLRKLLRDQKGQIKIFKNSLVEKALDGKMPELLPYLSGTTAFAFGFEDELAPAKIITSNKSINKPIPVLGGYFEGKVVTKHMVENLSKIPGREGLYSMILSCIQSPMRNLAYSLSEVAKQKTN